LDRFENLEMDRLGARKLVGAVAGADRAGQTVAAGTPDEFDRLVWIRQMGFLLRHGDVLLDAAQLPQFSLDADAPGVCAIHHSLGYCNVLLER